MTDFPCKIFETLTLKSPLILASGISGNNDSLLIRAARSGAAAVTTKGFTLKYQKGADNPVSTDFGCGLITNLGLTNPGVDSMAYMLNSYRQALGEDAAAVFTNIYAESPDDFAEITRKTAELSPQLIEADLPVPDEKLAVEITRAVVENANGIPVSIKISPDCCRLQPLAEAIQGAGASAITAVNSMPGMLVDAYASKPFLSTSMGGISGPAIKPIALHVVGQIYQAVDIPVIGVGGVMTGLDMVEMMMAGAACVGIGSALYYEGYGVFARILKQFTDFMESEGYTSVTEIIGKIWR